MRVRHRKGQVVDFKMESRHEGVLQSVVVEKVEIFTASSLPNTVALMTTITPANGTVPITYPSAGISEVSFTIPFTWSYGTYKILWTFRAGGALMTYHEFFDIGEVSWEFSATDKANYDFQFLPSKLLLRQGAKEFLRIFCKELYDRVYVITTAEHRISWYKSQYNVVRSDWGPMQVLDGGMLMAMFDSSCYEKGGKYFIQVKITMDNGEIFLSDEYPISVR